MVLSKQQLAGKLAKKTLSLDEKVKFLDFAQGNPRLGCRKLAEISKIGKIAAANISKEKKNIPNQHELFNEKSKKRDYCGKDRKINEILYEWYQRCCASNTYPNGLMLKEEAKTVKERLQDCSIVTLVPQMGGQMDGKLSTLSMNAELLVKLTMFQKKRSFLGWKDHRN